jgi:hypothetical protein
MYVDRRQVSEERRQTLRVAAVFAVKSQVGGRVVLGQSEDIGPAGITIRRPKDSQLPAYSAVLLSFYLPGFQGEVVVRGLVVNDTRAGTFRRTGLRFTALAPATERMIAEYCRRNAAPEPAFESQVQVA